jgi:hypothetical protein
MAQIGGRPVDALVFAVVVGFLLGGISIAFVYYFMM